VTDKPLYIFDIDGTLANIEHRLHFIKSEKQDWESFNKECFYDQPYKDICFLAMSLMMSSDVYFFTGRMDKPEDEVRINTWKWLERNLNSYIDEERLVMRANSDYRPDDIVKEEMYKNMLQEDKDRLICVFDDRQRVVDMWRSIGVRCLQVKEGDY